MKDLNTILDSLTESQDGYTRRAFLTNTSKSILAASVLSSLASCNTNAQQKAPSSPTDKAIHAGSVTKPIELKEIADPSEKKRNLIRPRNSPISG